MECLPGGQEGSSFGGFSLSLAVPTESESDRAFAALAEGGQVQMPLTKTFWSPRFGMLIDRFGIGWSVSRPNPFVKRAPFGSAPALSLQVVSSLPTQWDGAIDRIVPGIILLIGSFDCPQ